MKVKNNILKDIVKKSLKGKDPSKSHTIEVRIDKKNPSKFTWKEHNKWLSTFTDCKIVYPENKPVKKKRGKNAKR